MYHHLVVDEFVLFGEHEIAVQHQHPPEGGGVEHVDALIVALSAVDLSVDADAQLYVFCVFFGKPEIHKNLTRGFLAELTAAKSCDFEDNPTGTPAKRADRGGFPLRRAFLGHALNYARRIHLSCKSAFAQTGVRYRRSVVLLARVFIKITARAKMTLLAKRTQFAVNLRLPRRG